MMSFIQMRHYLNVYRQPKSFSFLQHALRSILTCTSNTSVAYIIYTNKSSGTTFNRNYAKPSLSDNGKPKMDQAADSPSGFVLQQLLFGMELRPEKLDRFHLKFVPSLERILSRHHTTRYKKLPV